LLLLLTYLLFKSILHNTGYFLTYFAHNRNHGAFTPDAVRGVRRSTAPRRFRTWKA